MITCKIEARTARRTVGEQPTFSRTASERSGGASTPGVSSGVGASRAGSPSVG
jgi:hypothetical protein